MSVWPLLMSVSLFSVVCSIITMLNNNLSFDLLFGFIIMVMILSLWGLDFYNEVVGQGEQGEALSSSIRAGMIFFIMSEVMFFITIFWGFFFWDSWSVECLGGVWEQLVMSDLSPYGVPILNSIVLLSSGVSVTLCHDMLMLGMFGGSVSSLDMTCSLGMMFSFLQYMEYWTVSFDFSTSVYFSIFFFSTGFHGVHVIVGFLLLSIMMMRLLAFSFSKGCFLGLELSAWYWHFVDVVWLFVYTYLYYLK